MVAVVTLASFKFLFQVGSIPQAIGLLPGTRAELRTLKKTATPSPASQFPHLSQITPTADEVQADLSTDLGQAALGWTVLKKQDLLGLLLASSNQREKSAF